MYLLLCIICSCDYTVQTRAKAPSTEFGQKLVLKLKVRSWDNYKLQFSHCGTTTLRKCPRGKNLRAIMYNSKCSWRIVGELKVSL